MTRFLIYLFPLAVDMVLGTLFFVCSLRLAESGAPALAVSLVCTAWALTYALTSLAAGRWVNAGNAARLTIGSCLALALLSSLFVVLPGLRMQYLLMVISGVNIALFYTPFQVFMKNVAGRTNWGLSFSIGLYTASWSCGLALGPFASGYLWQAFGWQICHLIDALAALAAGLGVYALRHHAAPVTDQQIAGEPPAPDEYATRPDCVWAGWLGGAACFLVVAVIRAIYPSLGTALGIGKADQGQVFAILFAMQAATGLFLGNFRGWMYRRRPLALLSLAGVAGLLCLGLGRTPAAFFGGALLFGLYSGMIANYFVFHSLVHPTRSTRNVSINEGIVGLTNIFGPLLGGLLADHAGLSAPFLVSPLLVLGAVLFQWQQHAPLPRAPLASVEPCP